MHFCRRYSGYTGLALLAFSENVTAATNSSRNFLRPLGDIAEGQLTHLGWVLLLMAVAVLPVFIATPWIYLRYRYGKNHTYRPTWSFNRYLEYTLWGIPALIVMALSVYLWKSTHADDPYQPVSTDKTPLCVQVIGLNWQWLFLYPQYHTASLNQLVIPVDRPVSLRLTTDTVMQSFRISSLAGQIYVMPGMQTQLHFSAFDTGTAWGENTQFNGDGFSGQHFQMDAVTADNFETWQQKNRQNNDALTEIMYAALGQPQRAVTGGKLNVSQYSGYPDKLFSRVMQRYHSTTPLPDKAQPGSVSYDPAFALLPVATDAIQRNGCSLNPTNKEHE